MKFPAWFQDVSIRRKFIFISLLATGVAVLFAIVLLTLMQWFVLRNELVKSVSAQASIIAANSTEAIVFNDHEKAEKIVNALGNINNIEFAGILDRQGQDFALYLRPGMVMPPHRHEAVENVTGSGIAHLFIMPPHRHQAVENDYHIHTARYIEVVVPVIREKERIGIIHVRASMAPVYAQLGWNILITVAAGAGAFLAAVITMIYLIPAITNPLHELIRVMEKVSRDNDFTLRSKLHGSDEMGMLAQGFNAMLEHIQQRDNDLVRHRERLEEEVAKRTARLTEAQRIAHLGNWEWDIVNNTLSWSDEIYRIFGLAPQQFGATYDAFLNAVHPEDRQRVDTYVRNALQHDNAYTIGHRILLPDGSLRYVHERAEVMRDGNGQALKMQGTVQDITERKQAEDEIRQLNENLDAKVKERTLQLLEAQEELVSKEKLAMLGQVAISMGQELRNPLGVMNNAVYFLQSVLPDADESVRDYLTIIKNEIAASERIISDLLDSAYTHPPHTETAGVRELIEQTLGKLTVPSSVTLNLDIPETLPPLRVDPQQIHQVLRNLISNAVEAMPEGGTLEIRAVSDEAARQITITVRDSGIGITPETLSKLFQPLFTTKARGIGLGLVVVKNLTEANGGTIEARSEEGKGSVFTLTLPSAEVLP